MTETMNEAAKMARREYYRRWRAANKDKIREANQRYWQRQGQIQIEKEKEKKEKKDDTD